MSPDKIMCKLCGDYVQLENSANTRNNADIKEDHIKEKHPGSTLTECFPNP